MNEADSYEAMLMEYEAEMDVDYGCDYDMEDISRSLTILSRNLQCKISLF